MDHVKLVDRKHKNSRNCTPSGPLQQPTPFDFSRSLFWSLHQREWQTTTTKLWPDDMEVQNLLLAEQPYVNLHETTDSQQQYATSTTTALKGVASNGKTSGAIFPSTTLPAIRPLHEDQLLDARPYNNEIDSLTLPEIDWQALTAPVHPVASSHALQTQQEVHVQGQAKRATKSRAPIAEVLNQASPVVKHAQRAEEAEEPDDRKRRRLEDPGLRTLPKPAPAAKQKSTKRHFLPPLLVPLHEPPPDAGLIPSMTTDGIRGTIDKVPSREELHIGKQSNEFATEKERSVEKDKAKEKSPLKKAVATKDAVNTTKGRRARHTWDEEETGDLLRGVAKFGIGNWKKILECPEFKFHNRTAVDLKDRFRTCCPEEYRKVGSTDKAPPKSPPKPTIEDTNQKPGRKKSSEGPATEKSSKFEHKLPDELARLGIEGPFPKAQRRTRRGFTAEEDQAILRGFEKYGAKWTKIQSDPDLGLTSRSRTDLRDRFRNKFPNKFIETGHKFKQKDGLSRDADEGSNEDRSSVDTTGRPSSVVQTNGLQPPPQQTIAGAVQDISAAQQPSLRLLTAPAAEPNFFSDFGGDVTPNSDEQGPITLSRNIFDWADQNSRATALAASSRADHASTANLFELSNTITTMDQFHINPMLALKVPHHHHHGSTAVGREHGVAAPSNLFPQLPLSGILNGPVSLPSAAELVSGLDAEGNM